MALCGSSEAFFGEGKRLRAGACSFVRDRNGTAVTISEGLAS